MDSDYNKLFLCSLLHCYLIHGYESVLIVIQILDSLNSFKAIIDDSIKCVISSK